MAELLFEIGCEEMPASFVKPAMDEILYNAENFLRKAGLYSPYEGVEPSQNMAAEPRGMVLKHGDKKSYGTPRRLAVWFESVEEQQPDSVEEALGPPIKVAFDDDGQPTKAAIGFAKSVGVDVADLETIETDKGPRLGLQKTKSGRPAIEVLQELLPTLIASLTFPKTMRWGAESFRFARPIHWFVALLDGAVIPFELAGIASGNTTRGHRFMAPAPIEVSGADDYLQKMDQASVMVKRDERKAAVIAEIEAAAAQSGGKLVPDDELIEEVTDLVETPVACLGSFDQEFLEVPRAVIISAMREHQRYFALEDFQGNLLANFIAVNNTRTKDLAVVAQGHERVLRARLADARFFLLEDIKTPLLDRLDDLKDVTFHAKLGTSYEKVQLAAELAGYLAGQLGLDAEQVDLAAKLAKCDLVTSMVGEFPSLQGVVGEQYALREGIDPAVAAAIREHYQPIGSGGELPTGDIGAVVGLADRLDSICGFIGVGLTPTGAADPYALRRAAIAVIRIIIEKDYTLSLGELTKNAVANREQWIAAQGKLQLDEVAAAVTGFFQNRLQSLLVDQGVPTDVAQAVLEAGFDDLVDAKARALALAQVKDSPDFAPLAAGLKRVMNILRKEADKVPQGAPSEDLLEPGAERELYDAFGALADEAAERIAGGDYLGFLQGMSGLKMPIDKFFDDVMVMVEDEALRSNRLALLNHIAALFGRVAQFTHLQLA